MAELESAAFRADDAGVAERTLRHQQRELEWLTSRHHFRYRWAGTTFIVQLCTELGLDTSFSSTMADHEGALLAQFFKLLGTLARHDIPFTPLEFARLVLDPDYRYRKLTFLLERCGWSCFREEFQLVAKPSLVHEFTDHSGRHDSRRYA